MKKSIKFNNNGLKMAGDLYLPENFDENKKYIAVVCTYPAGAVKEQISGLYAKKLSERGFVALAFDASHQGESEGTPRYMENPYDRVEDISCAIDWLVQQPFVDKGRIAALGICAGAGYTINAAMGDRRIKAVVGVSGTDTGAAMRDGWTQDTPIEQQILLLEEASEQRSKEAAGAPQLLGNYVPEVVTDDMPNTMKEAHEYYRTPRGGHPRSENKVSLLSMMKLFTFEAFHLMDKLLSQPLLMVVGEKSDAFYFSQRAYDRAASKDKELFVLPNTTHVDLYDREFAVNPASDKIAEFLNSRLN